LLHIDGQADGVYSLLEQPGELFTEDRWAWDAEEGDGALYKEALFRDTSDEAYFKDHRVSGGNEDDWMLEVNNAILNANTDAAKQLVLDTYFDTKSFIDVTAFNTVIGNTDDWRQRHNFLWYVLATYPPEVVRKQIGDPNAKKPKKIKKLVLIPSDYDRINDGNTQRANLLGKGPKHWYEPITPDLCTQVDQTPEQRAARQPREEYEYWVSLFAENPPNVGKPINCDQFTKVFSILGKQVNQKIVDLATGPMSGPNVESMLAGFAAQIQHLPGLDPDPPNKPEWDDGKKSLRDHLTTSRETALADARSELAKGTNTNTAMAQTQNFVSSASRALPPQQQDTVVAQSQNFVPSASRALPPPQQDTSMTQSPKVAVVSRALQIPQQASPQLSPSFASNTPKPSGTNSMSTSNALPMFQPKQVNFPSNNNGDSFKASSNALPMFQPKQAPSNNNGDSGMSFAMFQPKSVSSSSNFQDAMASMSASSFQFKPSSPSSSNIDIASRSLSLFPSKPDSAPSFSSFSNNGGSNSASFASPFPPGPPMPGPPPSSGWQPATSNFGLFQPNSGTSRGG
jgi:hypothetical protein